MEIHAGDIIGKVLREQGVKFLFTLCGGHISPILTGAKREGLRIIDVRDEDAMGPVAGFRFHTSNIINSGGYVDH